MLRVVLSTDTLENQIKKEAGLQRQTPFPARTAAELKTGARCIGEVLLEDVEYVAYTGIISRRRSKTIPACRSKYRLNGSAFPHPMRIMILGGGVLGGAIAKILCDRRHDVTIVEKNPDVARQLDDGLDAAVVVGSGTHANTLFAAGVTSTEICLAVTGNDEANLVGTSLAKAMGVRRCVAHVFAPSLRDTSTFDYSRHFNIDRVMSIESLTAAEIAGEIRETGDWKIEHFANGEIELQEVTIFREPPPELRKPLAELRFPPEVRVATIRRGSETKIATASDCITAGDRVSLIGVREEIERVKKKFQAGSVKKQRVLIGGGGETGFQLALLLETRGYSVTVMEIDRSRCDFLSTRLPRSTIIHGDATSRNDIYNEQIEDLDTFVACTGGGEANIISALEVRTYNPKIQTMILSDRANYRDLALRVGIDKAFVPAHVLARQVLGFLNAGAIVYRNTQLFPRVVDVLELCVPDGAAITKEKLRNVKLPPRCLFGAVIRDGFVQVPSADFQFRSGDDVVALVQPDQLNELVKLF